MMKNVFKEYLFNHGIFVHDDAVIIDPLDEVFATRYILSSQYGIRITKGAELVKKGMILLAADKLGKSVPEPFYRGFPDSVRNLTPDKLLFDQIMHYIRTYGTGNFSEAGHSIVEQMEGLLEEGRKPFDEKCQGKDFVVVTEEEAIKVLSGYVDDILSSTRPINPVMRGIVHEYIKTYDYKPNRCASKNTAIELLRATRDIYYARFIRLSDVIKLVDEINYNEYGGNKNIKKLNLKNQDRKFISKVIDYFQDEVTVYGFDAFRDCYEKKAVWSGLLHHIHYKSSDQGMCEFINAMRGKENFSAYSAFEEMMNSNRPAAAACILDNLKGTGAVLRNLTYILSRCTKVEEVDKVLDLVLETKNGIVLMQLLLDYSFEAETGKRAFKFTKHNILIVHTETAEEAMHRKSIVPDDVRETVRLTLEKAIRELYSGKLGKVCIDPDMKNIALPLQETASSSGYGVLPKGSRLHIPEGKIVRGFTYWEKVNDIDLSIIGIREDYSQVEFSWRTMYDCQSRSIAYSGDQTSGYYGGSEYFDVNVPLFKKQYPEVKYLIFCNNVYSGRPFCDCVCRAGYMLRDAMDSGEVFEPKTVKSSFTINCNSTFAYLFAIDLEKNDFIWLNIARDSHERIAGCSDLSFLIKYFRMTKVFNYRSFFQMLATEEAHSIVTADVIVTDKPIDKAFDIEGKEVIRSCDFERVMALMNLK